MKMTTLSTLFGIVLGLGTIAGASWAAWELRQEVASNTSWRLIQTFERLSIVRDKRRLTQIEWVTWCRAGMDLNVFVVCPRR